MNDVHGDHPPPEPDLAVLREEIRRAAVWSAVVRAALWGTGTLVVLMTFRFAPVRSGDGDLGLAAITAMACLLIGGSLVATVHAGWRRRIRRHLLRVDESHRSAALQALREATDHDAQRVVRPLLRGHRLPTEPVASSPPTGRGDEVTPEA